MKKVIEATDNDLAVIMSGSLKAAQLLATAATQQQGNLPLRDQYLEAMHGAMVAAEQARQMAGRELFKPVDQAIRETAPQNIDQQSGD